MANVFLQIKVDRNCSKSQKKMIYDAWNGAEDLDRAQQKYVPGGAFRDAMRFWFGENIEETVCFYHCIDYKARIAGNLQRRHDLDGSNAPGGTYLYLTCEDFLFEFTAPKDKQYLGYTTAYRYGSGQAITWSLVGERLGLARG